MIENIRSLIDKLHQGSSKPTVQSSKFQISAKVSGLLPCCCSTVSVVASPKDGGAPGTFRWYRVVEKRNYLIDHSEGVYNISVDDVGHSVVCVVSNDGASGLDFVSFGPIELHPSLKSDVEKSALVGEAVFFVKLSKGQPFDLWINPEKLIFSNPTTKESILLSDLIYKIDLANPLDLNLVALKKTPAFEKIGQEINETWSISVRFENFEARERFILIWKVFSQVKLLPYLKELANLEGVGKKQGFFGSAGSSSYGDVLTILSNNAATLQKSVNFAKYLRDERKNTEKYIESLENDLIVLSKDLNSKLSNGNSAPQENRQAIEKLEKSLMKINENQLERSRRGEDPKSQAESVAVLKEQLALERKQNFLLSNELKSIKDKYKEKRNLINKSLQDASFSAGVVRPSDLSKDYAHSEMPSHLSKADFAKRATPVKEKEPREIIPESEDFYKKQFEILREKLKAIANKSSTDAELPPSMEQDFKKSEKQTIELLNLENDMLKKRIEYLSKEKSSLAGQSSAQKDSQRTSHSSIDVEELHAKLAQLKSENSLLQKEASKTKVDQSNEEIFRKQINAFKVEIEKLRSQIKAMAEQEEIFKAQIEEKNASISSLAEANERLLESLKKMEEVMQINDSLLSNT